MQFGSQGGFTHQPLAVLQCHCLCLWNKRSAAGAGNWYSGKYPAEGLTLKMYLQPPQGMSHRPSKRACATPLPKGSLWSSMGTCQHPPPPTTQGTPKHTAPCLNPWGPRARGCGDPDITDNALGHRSCTVQARKKYCFILFSVWMLREK